MRDALGATQIEQQLAGQIGELFPAGGYRVDHLDCGRAMFQLNEPSPSIVYLGQRSIHQRYLDQIGNCVTNLNFFVDDIVHAQQLLTGLGAPIHLQGPSSAARCLADYGPDNTRPGAEQRQFYFIGSRQLVGFDLELMEPNFLHFSQQSVQYPCFVQPRPTSGDQNLELLRLIVVVPDLKATYHNLLTIFAPASRSQPYAYQQDSEGAAFRIGLGGIELEYREPRHSHGYLAEQLTQYGPGIIAIAFATRDMDGALRSLHETVVPAQTSSIGGRYRIRCRQVTGFDVVLEEPADSGVL